MENMILRNESSFANRDLRKATERIYKLGNAIRNNLFEVAAIIAHVAETECFKDDGFDNVHQWTAKSFGFKKTQSYDMLRVGREFTAEIKSVNGKVTGYGSNLLPANSESDFNTSQVVKLFPVGHDVAIEMVENGEINPEMTVKEIDKAVKARTKPEDDEETEVEEIEVEDEETEVENGVYFNSLDNIFKVVFNGAEYYIPADVIESYRARD